MSRQRSYDPDPRNHMQVSGQLHAPAALSSGKNTFTDWEEGWVGPRSRLDVKGEENISCTFRFQTPDSPSPMQASIHITLYGAPFSLKYELNFYIIQFNL
jgi:hypothetical protein